MIQMTYSKHFPLFSNDSDFRLKGIKKRKHCAESQSPPIWLTKIGFSVKDGLGSDQDAYFLEICKVSKL